MTLSIPDFSGLRVLVAGDAMLDEYWFGDTGRISPEAPVPVVRMRSTDQRPGGAANVALNLAALGVQTCLAAVVGADERGVELQRLLEQRGVRCEFIRAKGVPTIHKLRVLARSQQLIRLDAEQSFEHSSGELDARFGELLKTADIVVLSDYAKGTLANAGELVAACRAARVRVLIDPKGAVFTKYRGATALTPNRGEFEAVVGAWTDEAEFAAEGRDAAGDFGLGRAARDAQRARDDAVRRGEQPLTFPPRRARSSMSPARATRSSPCSRLGMAPAYRPRKPRRSRISAPESSWERSALRPSRARSCSSHCIARGAAAAAW